MSLLWSTQAYCRLQQQSGSRYSAFGMLCHSAGLLSVWLAQRALMCKIKLPDACFPPICAERIQPCCHLLLVCRAVRPRASRSRSSCCLCLCNRVQLELRFLLAWMHRDGTSLFCAHQEPYIRAPSFSTGVRAGEVWIACRLFSVTRASLLIPSAA